MAAKSPTRRSRAAQIGGIQLRCGPDDPRLAVLRRDQRVAEAEECLRRLNAEHPPPTETQLGFLAGVLFASATAVAG